MNINVQYIVTKDSDDSLLKVNDTFCFTSQGDLHVLQTSDLIEYIGKNVVESEIAKIKYEPNMSHALHMIVQLQAEVVSIKKAYNL